MEWFKKVVFENYANFSGRARRAEYWWYTLINILIMKALYILAFIGAAAEIPVITIIAVLLLFVYSIATFIPSLAVAIRRLHDTNKSGWFLLLWLIPLLGAIIIFVFEVMDGDQGPNQYGPSPKYGNGQIPGGMNQGMPGGQQQFNPAPTGFPNPPQQ